MGNQSGDVAAKRCEPESASPHFDSDSETITSQLPSNGDNESSTPGQEVSRQ